MRVRTSPTGGGKGSGWCYILAAQKAADVQLLCLCTSSVSVLYSHRTLTEQTSSQSQSAVAYMWFEDAHVIMHCRCTHGVTPQHRFIDPAPADWHQDQDLDQQLKTEIDCCRDKCVIINTIIKQRVYDHKLLTVLDYTFNHFIINVWPIIFIWWKSKGKHD